MKKIGVAGYPFIAMSIAFITIGISGTRAFIGIGFAFLILGVLLLKCS
jgi:hypothetical protein